jgi:protein-S-isoprenylcysteine O-methyltransferase Ste14
MLLAALSTVAWAFGVMYASIPPLWLIVHGGIERWRRRSRMRIMLVWPALWLVLGAATWRWRETTLYAPGWSWVAALPFFAVGLWVYAVAHKSFTTDQLIGRSELEPEWREQHLVATGVHARVRHPIYLAHLVMLSGWSVGSGLAVLFALTAFAIVTGAIMIRWEERELERRFGEAYRAYKERVPAIVPRFGA